MHTRKQFTTPFTLRAYQVPAVEYIVDVAGGMLNDAGGNWHLMSAPTGTGKSLVELEALSRVPDSILITPRLEIIAGMCAKMGRVVDHFDETELALFAWQEYGVTTPIRLRNMLIKGVLDFMPSLLIVDECFPGDTPVDTPCGPRRIDSIEINDTVLTYDASTGIIKSGRVARLFKNPAPERMVSVEVDGRTIHCTEDHPFLTHRGWVKAVELESSDELYCLPESDSTTCTLPEIQNSAGYACVLRENVHGGRYTGRAFGTHVPHEQGTCAGANEGAKSHAITLDSIKDARWCRLDSVTIHESGDTRGPSTMCRDGHVYNFEVEGTHTYMVRGVVVHNCHHDLANTYQDITMYINGVPKVGLTATPYRGTPKGTDAFLKQWGNSVVRILSLRDAVDMGFYHMPTVHVWPLIDDDVIDIQGGDFKISVATAHAKEASTHIAALCRDFYDPLQRMYDMPTLFAVPSTDAVNNMVARLRDTGLPAVAVTQETSRLDRVKAFELTEQCRAALVQISVVSEGVDLRIRRVVDVKSTMSPNAWFQLVGRVRPDDSGVPPEYICCNRNLERHCYLWEGLLPNSKVAEIQTAFTDEHGAPILSSRSGIRVTGLEGLGKFVKIPVTLLDGTIGFLYSIVHVHENRRTEYLAFVHPNYPEPVYGVKESAHNGTEMQWGKWRVVDALPDLQKGCASAKANPLTPKQQNRWNSSAESFGLDPHRKISGREFQILPFLMNTGLRL